MSDAASRKEANLRFMVLDDEDIFRRFLNGMLKSWGHRTIREARDGREGLDILESSAVDFILCDWHMPKMDGMAFLRVIRANPVWDLIPFILISAENSEEIAVEASDYGADAYVLKPLQPKALEDTIETIRTHREVFAEIYTYISRAKALCDVEAVEDAIAELHAVQGQFPDNALAWNESGLVHQLIGDDEAAERCHRKAIGVNETFLRSYDCLAGLYFNQHRFAEARGALLKAAEISPRNTDRHLEIGKTYLAEGDEGAARRAFERATADGPDPVARHSAVADIFLEFGHAEQAIASLQSAVAYDPASVHCFNQLGIALRGRGRFEEAAHNFRQALHLAPQDPVLYFNLALALIGQRDMGQASAALLRALHLDPEFSEAGELLDSLKNHKKVSFNGSRRS